MDILQVLYSKGILTVITKLCYYTNRSTVLDHKTFHRYTVRAKRGTIQSSRDSHHGGHKPKSAGASLRRYNESALEHVSKYCLS